MNDTLLGGLLALGGTILGGIISVIVEALRNRWNTSNRKYSRKKEVLDRRCEQAETYVQIVTGDFRAMMREAEIYLMSDNLHASQQNEARRSWMDNLDTRIYSLGPSISALSDEKLMEYWDLMMVSVNSMQQFYAKAWEYRFKGKTIDTENPMNELNDIWSSYAKNLGKFYKRLDELRNTLSES